MFYTYDRNLGKWVKDVPPNVNKFLTPTALAYFYIDDGALKSLNHSNAMRICTESFSLQGTERLQNALKDLHNVKTTLSKKTVLMAPLVIVRDSNIFFLFYIYIFFFLLGSRAVALFLPSRGLHKSGFSGIIILPCFNDEA
jgi:hypothetical protein